MVLLGGYHCIGNYTTNPITTKQLFPLDSAAVYDTVSGRWREQRLIGNPVPLPRIYHSAVTSKSSWAIQKAGEYSFLKMSSIS